MMKVAKQKCNTLIENGILKGYMQDKINAKLMNVSPTGNGRREKLRMLTYAKNDKYLHVAW